MSRNQSRTKGSTLTLRRFAVLLLGSSSTSAAAGVGGAAGMARGVLTWAPGHPSSILETVPLAPIPLWRMVGVGGIGILDFLQNTNDLTAACLNPITWTSQNRRALSHKRQLDRHVFEFPSLLTFRTEIKTTFKRDTQLLLRLLARV